MREGKKQRMAMPSCVLFFLHGRNLWMSPLCADDIANWKDYNEKLGQKPTKTPSL
jgi:hypothetical protein